jgi:UrcA family protein
MPENGIALTTPSLNYRSLPMRFVLPLIALAAITAPAIAAPAAGDTVAVRISYSDVDVTSAEGRAALDTRIEARLRKACILERAARYTHGRPAVDDKCVAEGRTAALAEVERVAAAEIRAGRSVSAN